MRSKAVLLGAAASLATACAAHAADLPMEKAAPAEYVKVCSQFGPEFFYIPGTDTCLKISGNIRADYGFNTATNSNRQAGQSNRATNQTAFQGRFQLGFDARTDTDYGLLRSFILIDVLTGTTGSQQWQTGFNSTASSTFYVDKAYIQFGGLTAGYAESFYSFYDNYFGDTYFAPYFGSGIFTQNLLAYTAQFGGGLSATVSMEDPGSGRGGFGGADGALVNGGTKMPNFVANVLYDSAWGKAQVMGAIHEADALGLSSGETKYGYAFGAGLSVNLPVMTGAYVALEGDYGNGASAFTGVRNNQFSPAGAPNAYDADIVAGGGTKTTTSWALTGEAGVNLTPQLKAMIFGSYGRYNAPSGALDDGDFTSYVAGGQLEYEIVKNMSIGAEVSYVGTNAKGLAQVMLADGEELAKQKTNALVAGVRLKRTF
ncbi:porin [Labrys monachus]|uniref:Porin n=1 Tax=Labrys monachus TaxID=217067 RepID=A0ABU0FDM1_9HYPH|nr:porin [Labrys monachus]MDQ0392712.1 hypothetical protein [Labrys monachus]